MADGMTVSLPALKRAWRAGGEESLWIRVQTTSPLQIAAAAAEAATALANEAAWATTNDGEPRIGGTDVSPTPQGPVIFVDYCDDTATLQTWLTRVADELLARGITGKLTPARTDAAPIDNEIPPLTVVAALTVPIDWATLDHDIATLHGAERGWYADATLTAALVTRLVRWCLFPGDLYLRHQVPQFRITPELAEPLITTALRAGPSVVLTCATKTGDFQRITFDLHGQVTLSRRRAGQTWNDDITSFEQILTAVAPLLEQGLIRKSFREASWGATINNTLQAMPYGGEGLPHGLSLIKQRKLFDQRTVDAYGIQVLTDAHLAHAHNLSDWDITDLGSGRHLVKARDLTPWFAQDKPDPHTLAQARNDFGDLILNPTVVKPTWPS
jgi:hypothetical protein